MTVALDLPIGATFSAPRGRECSICHERFARIRDEEPHHLCSLCELEHATKA